MTQMTFSDIEYSNRKRKTKREQFLDMMDAIIPWNQWINIIQPYYPSGKRGRPTRLSDEAIEDAVYDSYAMRTFMHIDFTEQQVPDATTLLKFRHLLEEHQLGEKIFADVTERLNAVGLIMHGGTIVDATIIASTPSTKNKEKKRDPEMHQTKKGNQWYHGMKVHAGVDAGTGYIHTITGTAANVHDIEEAHNLIREDDHVVYGDSGYLGIEKHDEIKNDLHLRDIEFRINRRPSSIKMPDDYKGINWEKHIEHRKSSVRCKVEHAFLIVKQQFGYSKTAYRGIAKNMNRFHVLFASANLVMCARAGRTAEFCRG